MANEKWYAFKALPVEEQKEYVRAKREAGMTDAEIRMEFEIYRRSWDAWIQKNQMWRKGCPGKPTNVGFKRSDTLCWDCQNCTGGCTWSRIFEPVEGWTVEETAEPTWVGKVQKMIPCINVVDCPEFIRG